MDVDVFGEKFQRHAPFIQLERAVANVDLVGGKFEDRVDEVLVALLDFGERKVRLTVLGRDHVDPRFVDIDGSNMNARQQEGRRAQSDDHPLHLEERGFRGAFGAVKNKSADGGLQCLPIEIEGADLGASAGGFLNFGDDSFAHLVREP